MVGLGLAFCDFLGSLLEGARRATGSAESLASFASFMSRWKRLWLRIAFSRPISSIRVRWCAVGPCRAFSAHCRICPSCGFRLEPAPQIVFRAGGQEASGRLTIRIDRDNSCCTAVRAAHPAKPDMNWNKILPADHFFRQLESQARSDASEYVSESRKRSKRSSASTARSLNLNGNFHRQVACWGPS